MKHSRGQKRILPLALALAIGANITPAYAGGGGIGCPGCATEWTQLMNNAELVQTYSEEIRQGAMIAQKLMTAYKQLEKGDAIGAMVGLNPKMRSFLQKYKSAKRIWERVRSIQNKGMSVAEKMKTIARTMEAFKKGLGLPNGKPITIEEIKKSWGELDNAEKDYYYAVAEQMGKISKDTEEDILDLNNDINKAEDIDATVEGLRYVAAKQNEIVAVLKQNQSFSQKVLKMKYEEMARKKQKEIIEKKATDKSTKENFRDVMSEPDTGPKIPMI